MPPTEPPIIIHRHKMYTSIAVNGNAIGGRFADVNEAWEYAKNEMGLEPDDAVVFDHVTGQDWNLYKVDHEVSR